MGKVSRGRVTVLTSVGAALWGLRTEWLPLKLHGSMYHQRNPTNPGQINSANVLAIGYVTWQRGRPQHAWLPCTCPKNAISTRGIRGTGRGRSLGREGTLFRLVALPHAPGEVGGNGISTRGRPMMPRVEMPFPVRARAALFTATSRNTGPQLCPRDLPNCHESKCRSRLVIPRHDGARS